MKKHQLLIPVLLALAACSSAPQRPAPVDQRAGAQPAPAPAPPPAPAAPIEPSGGPLAERADVQAFIRAMVARHGFDSSQLYAAFSRARSQPSIIRAMNRPAEGKAWPAYRQIFLTPQRVQGGVQFWRAHRQTLARAERTYGVPAEVIVAIIGVETSYGKNTGKYHVLEALATLAFDYPRRAPYFRKELENFLLLTRQEGIEPMAIKGSYAGAMGLGQFMPGSYLNYAVDFDGDGHRNLWSDPDDAIGSVANYLSKHRWRAGEPVTVRAAVAAADYDDVISRKAQQPSRSVASFRQRGVIPSAPVSDAQKAILLEFDGAYSPEYWLGFDNFYVITRYNQSLLYAMAVYQLSQTIRDNV